MIVITTLLICIVLATFVAIKFIEKGSINKLMKEVISSYDFTVMVSNIPKEMTKKDVKQFVLSHIDADENEIKDIIFCYDIEKEVQEMEEAISLRKKFQNFEFFNKDNSESIIKDELVIDLKRKHKAVRDARKRILNGDPEEKFTGKAFVILNNQKYVDVLINKFKRTRLKRILTHIAFQWLKLSKKKYQDDKWWQGKRVDMERATEPTNIYWENMAIQPNDRFWRTLATYGAACLCLLVVFFLNVGISVIQNNINEDLDKKDNKSFSYIFLTSLSFLSSILIAANNTILYHVIMYISKFERHQTHVKYYAAVSFKLTICMVINSGVIPLIVNPGKKNWFNPGGLAVDMFFIVFALSFISPTVCLFDPLHYWKRFRFWWEERKGEKSRMTQREANELAEGIEWEVPYYYGLSMSKLIITFFYTP
mmetsp:Transcript_17293/g.16954  ORF Transcript_17293/g.16954 Transcript_17293/m.16954 type:complete len:424 (+) Transcript_17293:564-1835(+)